MGKIEGIKNAGRFAAFGVLAFGLALTPLTGIDVAKAAVGTQTWSGAAGDGLFSTAGNWVEDEVPETGDTLVFNSTSYAGEEGTITNDLDPSVRFAGINLDNTGASSSDYLYISGVVNLQADATLNNNGTYYDLHLNDGINGAGNVLVVGGWSVYTGSLAGQLTVDSNTDSFGGSIGGSGLTGITGLTLDGSTQFSVYEDINFPITVAAGSSASLNYYSDCKDYEGFACVEYNKVTRTLSGDLTLNSNLRVTVHKNVTVNITGDKTGSGKVVRGDYSSPYGVLKVGSQTLAATPKTTTFSGNISDYESVLDKETATLSGTRGGVKVYGGGTLKGTGTAGYLNIYEDGVLAPGNSPGTITALDSLYMAYGATYEVELLNKNSYDKVIVGEDYDGPYNAVDLNGATFALHFVAGGQVSNGETFTIIDNRSSTDVDGTFSGLAEGARITIGEAVFAISYQGGDGNDVVLTALTTVSAPGTPNTGFKLLLANPALVAVLGVAAAVAMAVTARRLAIRK